MYNDSCVNIIRNQMFIYIWSLKMSNGKLEKLLTLQWLKFTFYSLNRYKELSL